MKLKNIWPLIKKTFQEFSEDKAPRLAAALSYYTLFSLAPLLVIVISIAGFVLGRQQVEQQVLAQIGAMVGQQGMQMIQGMIQSTQSPKANLLATIVGIVLLLFGAAGVFGQLHDALNTIWEVEPKPGRGVWGLIKDRFLSFTMILGVGFLLLVSLIISAALAALGNYLAGLFPGLSLLFQVINIVITFGVITLLFALIFRVLPDVKIAWRDVWLGAAVTAILFMIGEFVIGLYIGRSSVASIYGAAGSLVVILLWIYYSSQIMFLGAEFTQVYANQFGSKMVLEDKSKQTTEAERQEQGIPHQAQGTPQPATFSVVDVKQANPVQPTTTRIRQTEMELEPLSPAPRPILTFVSIIAALVGFLGGLFASSRRS